MPRIVIRGQVLLLGWIFCAGCAPHVATPAPLPSKVETGRECAAATVACEPGRCTAEVDDRCPTPVTCRLRVESQCVSSGGETGPAAATTKAITQLAHTTNVIEALTNCEGTAVDTRVLAVECI